MSKLKSDRKELFAINLSKGMTQDAAYSDAGYKPNRSGSSRLAANVNIINRVAELRSRQVAKVTLTRHYILEAAIENAEKALGRRPVRISKGGKDKEPVEVYVYEGQVANAALKMLGSELNMFVDRKDVRIVNEYDKLSDDELAEELKRAAQLLLESNMKVIEHEGE